MLQYRQQDSPQTLAEGLAEYRAANPGLDEAREGGSEAAEFFRCHDTVHVVFGCSTTLLNEALADAWTIFGTTASVRRFLRFLEIEEHKAIVAKVGWWAVVRTAVRAAPLILTVAWRSFRMRSKWPWEAFDGYSATPLYRIRRELGIRIVAAP